MTAIGLSEPNQHIINNSGESFLSFACLIGSMLEINDTRTAHGARNANTTSQNNTVGQGVTPKWTLIMELPKQKSG